MRRRLVAKETISVVASLAVLIVLSMPLGAIPPLGGLANPGGGIWSVADQAVYPAHAELSFPELDATATVLRDHLGIPHIFADTEHDLFFAQGFVHAQDRLWQMDFTRRAARGELAEVFGATVGTFDVLEVDTFIRTIGLPELARRYVSGQDTTDPAWRSVDAYAAGVNAFLRHAGTAGLPLEFKLLDYRPAPWTPEDTFAFALLQAWILSGTFEDLELALLAEALPAGTVEELAPILGPYQPPVDPRPGTRGGPAVGPEFREAARDLLARSRAVTGLLGGGPLLGSNNWVVAGNRTDTGRPRLANDIHLAFQLPAIWYENHLVGGGFDVYGVSFPGAPWVILGQNRAIAWGVTNVGADVVDLYRETIDGNRYRFRGEWHDLEQRTETIRVKGGESVPLTVRSTVHGPLVTERGETLAMRWTGQDAAAIIRVFYGIDRARTWDEFKAAVDYLPAPAQNFVYADADHIGVRTTGFFPLRPGFDGRFPLDGASGAFEWAGFVPPEEYPESFDPDEGYAFSANQQPQYDEYPHYLGWTWASGHRARRIQEMVAADADVTAQDLGAMQLDTLDVMAREVSPFVDAAVAGTCSTATCNDALAAIRAWDYRMVEGEGAPAIWYRFATHLRTEMFADEWAAAGVSDLPYPNWNVVEFLVRENPGSRWFDDVGTPAEETWQDIVRRAFTTTVDALVAEIGPTVSAWRWGDVHGREFPHLTQLAVLGRGPFPSEGGGFTVNVAGGDVSRHGPSWRLLADLADPTRSRGAYPGGQSGNPLSPHYDDILQLWRAGEYHDVLLPAVASKMAPTDVESTLILRGT